MILCLCASFCSITQTIGHIIIKVASEHTLCEYNGCFVLPFALKNTSKICHKKKEVNLLVVCMYDNQDLCWNIGKLGVALKPQ